MEKELSQLLREMVENSSIPAKELARIIGKPYSTLMREVNPYDRGAKLGAYTLLQLMQSTHNVSPLQFMARKMGYTLHPLGHHRN